jgi:hypothetical protein
MDHLELLFNGAVLRRFSLTGERRSLDIDMVKNFTQPGWLLLRAYNDGASPLVFDIYPYATTSPLFLSRPGATTHCGVDADYFLAWIDRLATDAAAHPGYNTADERKRVLDDIAKARAVFANRK